MSIKEILSKEISKQFLKFCFIGLEITIFSYLLFIVLFYFFSVNYIISSGIGFIGGVLLGFIFNKMYTFKSKRKNRIALPQYFLVYLVSLIVTMVLIRFFVENLNFHPLLSYLVIEPIIIAINFLGTKIWVFKNKQW
jgi:putative flippase GtrA